jgi:hypothetical protein
MEALMKKILVFLIMLCSLGFSIFSTNQTGGSVDLSNYNGNVSNSIAFNNPSLVDENSWYYYDDPQNIMSKCFAFTENNTYSSSPYHNDLYCLGTLRNSLFLQKTSLDRILQISSSAQYNQAPNSPEQVFLLDGANYTGTEFVGVISPGTNFGIVNKRHNGIKRKNQCGH